MPIYEYLCTSCDHSADILHGISEPGPHFCPSCGKEGTMRKQFVAPTIHYKGSGWAKKDRGTARSGTKAASRTSDGTASADAKPGDTTRSDSGTSSESSSSATSPSTDTSRN
jgi:putative FmdB family regulatory protein